MTISFSGCCTGDRQKAGFGDRQDKSDACSLPGLLPFIVSWGLGHVEEGEGDILKCHTDSNLLHGGRSLDGLTTFNSSKDLKHSQPTFKIDFPRLLSLLCESRANIQSSASYVQDVDSTIYVISSLQSICGTLVSSFSPFP